MSTAVGLLLAAGAGRRMGTPKALLRDGSGEWYVTRVRDVLRAGGCDPVIVVVGAAAGDVAAALRQDPGDVRVVVAEDWAEGMGASLRAGLHAALETPCSSALVSLVDLPDVGADVVRRILDRIGTGADVLARASYDGVTGHPVLIGRDHWPAVVASARGDRGAREFLAEHPPSPVECGDLATGHDVDTPDDLARS